MDYRKAYGLPERFFLSLGRMVEKKNLATLVSAYARYAEGVAVAGEKLKVKGNDWEKQGDMPGGVASPPQAEGSEVVTSHQLPATRYSVPALVFVGSGELEGALREQARGLGLRVIDRSDWKAGQSSHRLTRIDADKSERLAADRTGESADSRMTSAVGDGPREKTDDCKLNTENSVESDRGAVYFYGFRQIEENPVFYALAEVFVLPSLKEEWGLVVNEAMAAGLPVIVSRTAGCAEDLLPGSEQVTGDVWRVTSGEQEADARAGRSMEHGAGPPARRPYGSERSMESGENAASLNVAYGPSPAIRPTVQRSTLNSLEERSNGFVFDPSSVDALSEALRRIADPLNPQRSTLNAAAMGRRSREIVAKFSCENFARQALSAARAAEQV